MESKELKYTNEIFGKVCFGGLINLSKNAINLRKKQILEGFRIHSCYHYGKALDVIKQASEEVKIIPKLTTKVYFNLNIFNRHDSILNQLNKITEKLNYVPKDWHIQLCANPSINDLMNNDFEIFKEKIFKNFGKLKIFIETYPLWEKNTLKIIQTDKVIGSAFHLNPLIIGVENDLFYKKPFYCIGLLGGGKHYKDRLLSLYKNLKMDDIDILLNKIKLSSLLDFNISYFLNNLNNPNFLYSITAVNSEENYDDLKKKILFLKKLDNDQMKVFLDFKKNNYNKMLKLDPYGVKNFKFIDKIRFNRRRFIHDILTFLPFVKYKKKFF